MIPSVYVTLCRMCFGLILLPWWWKLFFFWCCLKTLLLLSSNGCNAWLHFHSHFWTHTRSLVPHLIFEFSPYSVFLSFMQSYILTNPSLEPHATLETSFFPVSSSIPAITLPVNWKPIPHPLHPSLSLPYHLHTVTPNGHIKCPLWL